MASLSLIPQSPSAPQGQPVSLVLRADFDTSVLGSAVVRLLIPGTGFSNIDIAALAFIGPDDVFVPVLPGSPLAPTEVFCARTAGTAGPVDLLRIDALVTGERSAPYVVSADVLDAHGVDGAPLPLIATEIEITVDAGDMSLVSTALEPGYATVPYRDQLHAQGGRPPYAWTLATGDLPPTMSLHPDGALTGTPPAPTVVALEVRATDADGQSAQGNFTLRIRHPPLRIALAELPPAAPGRHYLHTLTATGGKAPLQWHIEGLPAGMGVLGNTLRGTPDETRSLFGAVPLTVRATDADSPPQVATAAVDLPFLPARLRQQETVARPGAIVVGRDLCWIDYQVTAVGKATRPEIHTDFFDELDRARDELAASIAELAVETFGISDPGIRREYHSSLGVLMDSYRDLDAHRRNGSGFKIELRVLVDDQLINTAYSGGQRTIHEWRGGAGRPLLPYVEPRSARARLVRRTLTEGGRGARAWARGVLDATFDDYAAGGRRKMSGTGARFMSATGLGLGSGMSAIFEGLTGVIPALEDFGFNLGRWFDDLFPKPGIVRLTPGRHKVQVRWDGAQIVIGQILTSIQTRSEIVSFTVTFQPLTGPDGPRFASPTVFHGTKIGMPGSQTYDASLSSSGTDVLVASDDGLMILVGNGRANQPYERPIPYDVQPGFTPERMSVAHVDPYGRTSLLMHSASEALVVLNQGPAGLQALTAPLDLRPGELLFAASAGAREESGWRGLLLSAGSRLAAFNGLDAVRLAGALGPPTFLTVGSPVSFDTAACLALVTLASDADDEAASVVAAGLDVGGHLAIVGGASLGAAGPYRQPFDLLAGNLTGGGGEVAAAFRQERCVRLFRFQSGTWQALPPAKLGVRPWELATGPLASGCVAVAAKRFGSVLLLVWDEPDFEPKVLPLRSGCAGARIGGCDGVLAVSDPVAGAVIVYR